MCGNHQWVLCGKHGTGNERAGMALGEVGLHGEKLVTSASECLTGCLFEEAAVGTEEGDGV